ncbi:hypothetical protein PVAP13_7NG022500 [Panicum virgatum]|uniref:GDT1 family protein n=2 Tax=Panicum virgatum TaxID=38727 RepID=A0A8T0PWH1_PANVG|nr:hypothetical protein PVAP13_7NG022500 [Panicum virgatum]
MMMQQHKPCTRYNLPSHSSNTPDSPAPVTTCAASKSQKFTNIQAQYNQPDLRPCQLGVSPYCCSNLSSSVSTPHQHPPRLAMSPSLFSGFTKSPAMTALSEIGDRTFCVAAILAMRHPRRLVLAGCVASSVVMTLISSSLGWVAPNLISSKWSHYITTMLFFVFGVLSLRGSYKEDGDSDDELEEVEAELDANSKNNHDESKNKLKDDDDTKKHQRTFLMRLFSPVFIKAFSITFFGEWGDMSQIATIVLAADENPLGVVLGGVVAQALCTTAAVLGGKSLASKISEKMVGLLSGALFLVFGMMSLLSGPEGEL